MKNNQVLKVINENINNVEILLNIKEEIEFILLNSDVKRKDYEYVKGYLDGILQCKLSKEK